MLELPTNPLILHKLVFEEPFFAETIVLKDTLRKYFLQNCAKIVKIVLSKRLQFG